MKPVSDESEYQDVFNRTQHGFRAELEKSAEMLREAIAAAQRSIAGQLSSQTSEAPAAGVHLKSVPAATLTADMVEAAFARAREIVGEVERLSVEAQAVPFTPQTLPPLPGGPNEPIPSDPLEATNFLMSQAARSMSRAMDSVLHSMASRTGGSDEIG